MSAVRGFLSAIAACTALTAMLAEAAPPLVVFDLPLTIECRDVTPKNFEKHYRKKIFEAVFKISPRLLEGDEKDLKNLHYELSTEQQMPVVSYLPNSQVASDVAGDIAITTSERHGQLLVHYFFTPAAGDGSLQGDLESSAAQYALLAPKRILLAAGTIQRGCGVYYDLKPSTQDTLQKQREYACLFEVPANWRADYATVTCRAKGMKRGLLGTTEFGCGTGTLSVGLYKQHDADARDLADELARKQQIYLDRLTQEAGNAAEKKPSWLADFVGALERVVSNRSVMKAKQTRLGVGAALQSRLSEDKGLQTRFSEEAKASGDELTAARAALRRLNGKEEPTP